MNRLFIHIALIFNVYLYAQNNPNGVIEFDFQHAPDSFYFDIRKNNKSIDSVLIIKGKGEWRYQLDEKVSRLWFMSTSDRGVYKVFFINGGKQKMKGDLSQGRSGVSIEGSKENDIYEDYYWVCKPYNKHIKRLKKMPMNEASMVENDSITYYEERLDEAKIGYFKKYNSSYAALHNLKWECIYQRLAKDKIKIAFDGLSKELRESEDGRNILTFTTLPNPPKKGDKYVDFEQVTTDGKPFKLSDYDGKTILIVFWGSGCVPCLESFSYLKDIYNLYRGEGLEIIGVSSDTDKEKWIETVKKYRLPWVNVTDFKGHMNVPNNIYGVRGIPHIVMINRYGEVVYTLLRGEENIKEALIKEFI